jgi:dephospho-CoA kinase
VHDLYEDDPDVRRALEGRFGTTERSRIGEIVFADAEQLAWLEGLLHPRVRERYARWLEGVQAPVAVVEIPLLYETGAEALFDAVVVITAREELRRERAGAWVEQRSRRLLPDEEKIARAEFSYVNDGTLEELDDFVVDVLRRVT